MADPFELAGTRIPRGGRATVELELPALFTHTQMTLPVHVLHGRRPGPTLLVCAALHGDELNGIEVVRRLLARRAIRALRGTLLAVPMVNVFGVLQHSRYLPDGRDLNRSFPGSQGGSTAARIADLFMREVVSRCTHGVDLHTASGHRTNLPQIRANLDDAETERLARAFGAPVVMHSRNRDGSLREAASELGVPWLLYEAGERLRFGELEIAAGVRGVIHVMRALGMLRPAKRRQPLEPAVSHSSRWVRAPSSGVVSMRTRLGAHVAEGEVLATVSDPVGGASVPVVSSVSGIIIGLTRIPLVHEGDALFNVARFDSPHEAAETVEAFHDNYLEESEGPMDGGSLID